MRKIIKGEPDELKMIAETLGRSVIDIRALAPTTLDNYRSKANRLNGHARGVYEPEFKDVVAASAITHGETRAAKRHGVPVQTAGAWKRQELNKAKRNDILTGAWR